LELGLGGKVAIVTAGSQGIGKAIAEELAREGVKVSICARGKEDLEQAAKEIGEHGPEVLPIPPTSRSPRASRGSLTKRSSTSAAWTSW
jgi:NAD(P)-dependent dehydrogenase (short-subunit alcohol dehydrogenase family)